MSQKSTVVNHIKSHRGNMSLFRERLNWLAMTKPDHSRKTARFDVGLGRPRSSCSSGPAAALGVDMCQQASTCNVRWCPLRRGTG
ncbi:hypothetical protein CBM2586_P310006 [Cupriavidus phytorum]|uniref:Uncharacterized protein n=1 Tax=Cupriavidus taiwanensis TaxID=164546 RepID=A0A976AE53_9BURK|nr:hypothetical protein CBM2586_P310006 [Cupriavidus taiwanensis]